MKIKNKITYLCDGIQNVFEYNFKTFTDNDIKVYFDNRLQDEGFKITSNPKGNGGSINFFAPPPANENLIIVLDLDFSRKTDFRTGGIFRAEDLNMEFDYIMACLNQLNTALDASIKISNDEAVFNTILPPAKSGNALVWNDNETGFVSKNIDLSEQLNYVEDCTNTVEALYNNLTETIVGSLPMAVVGKVNNILEIMENYFPEAFTNYKSITETAIYEDDYGSITSLNSESVDYGSI